MTGTAERSDTRDSADAGIATRVAHSVARSVWGDRSARVGLASRAIVYLVLALLVGRIAAGMLGPAPAKPASGTGVAQAIGQAAGGTLILIVLATGMLLFALFSLLDAILHHNDETPWAKRWGDRLLSVWGFLLYAGFAVYCLQEALAGGSTHQHAAAHSRHTESHLTATVLRWPGGPVWLGIVAAVLFVIAFFLTARGLRATFAARFDVDHMSPRAWRVVKVFGVGGSLGRAEMFGIIGWFVLTAAVDDEPSRSEGLDGSVRRLADSGVGTAVLWVLTAGLVMYALFTVAEARYRKV